MNQKSFSPPKKKSNSIGKWFQKNPFFILILFLGLGIFFVRWMVGTPKKSFFMEKSGDKLQIHGLEKYEIEKIKWDEKVRVSPPSGSERQFCFQSEDNWWVWLFRKPTIYYSSAALTEKEVRNKEIEFEGFPEIKNKRIIRTELRISSRTNLFEEESFGLGNILYFLFVLLSIFVSFLFIDHVLGTNFTGFITGPFTTSRDDTDIPSSHLRFKDVGGLWEAKEELGEVVSYFQNPRLFWQRGAKVPKGILLVGPPGNGKTLLAKALAGECGLPFLFRSGSEFEEMVVGLGARRVRQLFTKARSYPQGCIIFIDEIDSIGQKRYSFHSSHSELTLNQLLSELDGFHPRGNIIILAATNSLNVLDSALLRPGRFDRQIYIPLPNLKGRREIINLCTRKLPLKASLDTEEIVSMTKGMSGAEITNMFNEASILSIRYQRKSIDQEIIFEAYDRILMGPSLTSQTVTPHERRITAYHEAGHATVAMSLPETTVKKITIVPRLRIGGYTWIDTQAEKGDDEGLNKSEMLAYVATFLGGRSSEELILGPENITMGAYSDFKNASKIIRSLILHYGMSDLGIVPTQDSYFHGQEIPAELPEIAKQKIENERQKILNQCWKKARDILHRERKTLDLLAEILLQKNSLQKGEVVFIFLNKVSPYLLFLTSPNEKR